MIKKLLILAIIALFIVSVIAGWYSITDATVDKAFAPIFFLTIELALFVRYGLPIIYAGLYFFTSYVAYAEGESLWWQPLVLWVPIVGPILYWAVIFLRSDSWIRHEPRKANLAIFIIIFSFVAAPGVAATLFLAQHYGPYTRVLAEPSSPSAPTTKPKPSLRHSVN